MRDALNHFGGPVVVGTGGLVVSGFGRAPGLEGLFLQFWHDER